MTSPDTPLFMSVQVEGDVELSPRLRVGATVRSQWATRNCSEVLLNMLPM